MNKKSRLKERTARIGPADCERPVGRADVKHVEHLPDRAYYPSDVDTVDAGHLPPDCMAVSRPTATTLTAARWIVLMTVSFREQITGNR
jgi:hypothetical protein